MPAPSFVLKGTSIQVSVLEHHPLISMDSHAAHMQPMDEGGLSCMLACHLIAIHAALCKHTPTCVSLQAHPVQNVWVCPGNERGAEGPVLWAPATAGHGSV